MGRLRWALSLLLLVLVSDWADAATYYVRPGHDGNGNTFTYGTGTGLSNANALAGFATINSGAFVLAPDDVVCLPDGATEPFFESLNYQTSAVNGTAGHPITFRGCDAVVSGDGKTSTGKR